MLRIWYTTMWVLAWCPWQHLLHKHTIGSPCVHWDGENTSSLYKCSTSWLFLEQSLSEKDTAMLWSRCLCQGPSDCGHILWSYTFQIKPFQFRFAYTERNMEKEKVLLMPSAPGTIVLHVATHVIKGHIPLVQHSLYLSVTIMTLRWWSDNIRTTFPFYLYYLTMIHF